MSQTNPEVTIDERLRKERDLLSQEFKGTFSPETIERCLQESFDSLPSGGVAHFRPMLAYRFARERLRATAQSKGTLAKDKPEILFVCVHNAGRSQMAAALTLK